jgi:predicted phosphohydrolase
MKFQYVSDLHLEFKENARWLSKNPINPKADILLLAGDIMNFHRIDQGMDFLKYCSDQWEETYWVGGNHEFYGSDIEPYVDTFCESILDNVFFLNNTVKRVGDIDLLFTSLWTDIPDNKKPAIGSRMNDYRMIRYGKELFTCDHANSIHEKAKDFLVSYRKEEGVKSVVVSHHVPTFVSYPSEFRRSVINNAFATDMDLLIEATQHEAWIFGHHHRNVKEFKVGNTRMLTNQLGYIEMRERKGFDPEKVLML